MSATSFQTPSAPNSIAVFHGTDTVASRGAYHAFLARRYGGSVCRSLNVGVEFPAETLSLFGDPFVLTYEGGVHPLLSARLEEYREMLPDVPLVLWFDDRLLGTRASALLTWLKVQRAYIAESSPSPLIFKALDALSGSDRTFGTTLWYEVLYSDIDRVSFSFQLLSHVRSIIHVLLGCSMASRLHPFQQQKFSQVSALHPLPFWHYRYGVAYEYNSGVKGGGMAEELHGEKFLSKWYDPPPQLS